MGKDTFPENPMAKTIYCKKRIYGSRQPFGGAGCSRVAVRDGWCKQHHPDSVRERREKQEAKWAEVSRQREEAYRQAEQSRLCAEIGRHVLAGKDVHIVHPPHIVTADLRFDRVRVFVDKDGKVLEIKEG